MGKDLGRIAAVGLIMENAIDEEAFFITMLCSSKPSILLPFGRENFLVPRLAVGRADALASRSLDKSVRPLISELMHFAGGLPGGIPVKERGPARDPSVGLSSSLTIQKKVHSDQWGQSVESAKSFAAALAGSLPQINSFSMNAERVHVEPCAFDSPALVRFARIVEDKVQAFRKEQDDSQLAKSGQSPKSTFSW